MSVLSERITIGAHKPVEGTLLQDSGYEERNASENASAFTIACVNTWEDLCTASQWSRWMNHFEQWHRPSMPGGRLQPSRLMRQFATGASRGQTMTGSANCWQLLRSFRQKPVDSNVNAAKERSAQFVTCVRALSQNFSVRLEIKLPYIFSLLVWNHWSSDVQGRS